MKKTCILLSIVITFVFCKSVSASSGNLIVSSENINVGNQFTVTVKINSAAAWNIHVTSTGPVENCVINQADSTSDALDTDKIFKAECKATNTGTINIFLSGDITSASDGIPIILSQNKTINVTKTVDNNTTSTNNNNKSNNTGTSTNNQNNNVTEENESEIVVVKKQSKITNFHIVGYDIDFSKDKMSYDLNVPSDLKELYILVEGEGITVSNDKIVNIENKSYITVAVRADDKSINYRINLKREKSEIKDNANTKKKSFIEKIPLLSNIILVIALILLFLKYKKAKNSI